MIGDDTLIVVADTSVVSLIFNGDTRSSAYLEHLDGRHAVTSFQTLEELQFGAYKAGWGRRRRSELNEHLRQYHVAWPNPSLVRTCARLRSECEARGRRLETADAWIAATAVMLSCPLASHDRDFSGIPGLEVTQVPDTQSRS